MRKENHPIHDVERANPLDRDQLRTRQARLDTARSTLKQHFVGIDTVIDGLCDAVAVWYLMPEVLTRPPIVNLWGMTGVGKTDLVRRRLALLDLTDRFVEFELSNSDFTIDASSVSARLAQTRAVHGEPTLLLFDEIQRFNTIDQDGRPVSRSRFSDFWELLSDGRLSRREREDIDLALGRMLYGRHRDDDGGIARIAWWESVQLHQQYGIGQSADALVGASVEDAAASLRAVRDSKRLLEPIDCSKCLVVISGNLDEAFTMAGESAEADIDADIFHAFTSRVTMLDIKAALARRFKPEQVARFGNVHLIYPSLRRRDFSALIDRELRRLETSTADLFGIDLSIAAPVADLVYRNGVFPVQGARPVFSTIAGLVETNLAKVLFEARIDGHTTASLDHDADSGHLVAVLGGAGERRELRLPVAGAIDRIRRSAQRDLVADVAVHEAGHALTYALGFGLAPLQLTARAASGHAAGFSFPHDLHLTADSLLRQVRVHLAGGLAEEELFGAEHASAGREHDRQRATMLVVDHVRRYGFSAAFTAHYSLVEPHLLQRSRTDATIEAIVAEQEQLTRELLADHRPALIGLARDLAGAGHLSAPAVAAVLARYDVPAAVAPEGHRWIPPYAAMLDLATDVEQGAQDDVGNLDLAG